jgi:hypothetical protein
MTVLLILAAIPGVLAVMLRLSRALTKAVKFSLERFVARQIVQQRAERGDLTGMEEADRLRVVAARQQMRHVGMTLVWIALLALPLVFPPAIVLYPFYSIFWFV